MKHHFSASKRRLLQRCAWWARPDVELPPWDPTEAAERGTALHRVAAGEAYETVAEEYGYDVEELAELVAVWREWWPEFVNGGLGGVTMAPHAVHGRTEVPYAYDTATGAARELPGEGQRDYSDASETEVPGTADVVIVDPHFVVTIDLKTGRPPKTLAEYREQLEHNALAATRVHGVEEAVIMVAHVTPAGVEVDVDRLDALDLAGVAGALAAEVASIPNAEPRPGAHCRDLYCPALAVCPMTQTSLALVPDVRRLPLVGEVENDADAALLIDALPRFEAWAKDRKAAMKRYVKGRDGGVVLPDGRIYTLEKATRETVRLDVRGALEALRSVLGAHTDEALTVRASKESIERAARVAAGGKRGEVGRLKKEAIEALRAAGAVKVSVYDEPEIREPALPAMTGTSDT